MSEYTDKNSNEFSQNSLQRKSYHTSNNFQPAVPYSKSKSEVIHPGVLLLNKNCSTASFHSKKQCCCPNKVNSYYSYRNYSIKEIARKEFLGVNKHTQCSSHNSTYHHSIRHDTRRQLLMHIYHKKESKIGFVPIRCFGCDKTVYSSNNNKENINEKSSEKTWTKQINNCKVTYHGKKDGSFFKDNYTVVSFIFVF